MKTEQQIELQVRKWARTRGWLVIKFTPKGDVGWPDRIFISPTGTHVWIEFKAPGKKPRELQWYRLKELRSNGVNAEWFDNAEEAISYLDTFT